MSKLLAAMLLAVAVSVAATGAQAEIAVEKVGASGIKKVAAASGAEIKAFFSDHTFIMRSRNSTAAYPFNGASFVYFAPSGRLALWRGLAGDLTVKGGTWEAGWLGDNETLLCMDFDGINQGGSCVVLESARTLIEQRAAGNVFGLKAGATGPIPLRGGQVDFKFVAKRLGL
jgi:hypothetical protein